MRLPSWCYERTAYSRMLKGWVVCVAVVAGCVALLVGGLALSWAIESRNCALAGRQYERPTRYDLLAGCFIASGDRHIALDKYIAVTGDE